MRGIDKLLFSGLIYFGSAVVVIIGVCLICCTSGLLVCKVRYGTGRENVMLDPIYEEIVLQNDNHANNPDSSTTINMQKNTAYATSRSCVQTSVVTNNN